MRRILATIKFLTLSILFLILFIFVWNPVVQDQVDHALVKASQLGSSVSNSYLSRISTVDHEAEYTMFSHETASTAGTQVISSDDRVVAMRQFLIDHHSPLYPYAEIFVTEADKVDLDWRLVASISGVESAFGNLIPFRSNNAWGWKGDPTRDWSYFTSWKVGISTVTERIALGYGTDITPFTMESTYCPPCGLNPEHAWANGVNNYMYQLEQYRKEIE